MEWYLLEEHAQNPAQCHPEKEKMVMFLEEQSKADKVESNYYISFTLHCFIFYTGDRCTNRAQDWQDHRPALLGDKAQHQRSSRIIMSVMFILNTCFMLYF